MSIDMDDTVATECGRVLDLSQVVVKIDEAMWWNGNNHISRATGCQFRHEQFMITRKGGFVIYSWSQYQNERDSYEVVTPEKAAQWLATNANEADMDSIRRADQDLHDKVRKLIEENEV